MEPTAVALHNVGSLGASSGAKLLPTFRGDGGFLFCAHGRDVLAAARCGGAR